jgi:hypothetical protein
VSCFIAEKSLVNEVALTSGTDADEVPPDEPPDDGVPPDELLPHAVATRPTPRSAAASARLLVLAKVILHRPGWSSADLLSAARRSVVLQFGGPYDCDP